MPQNLSLLADFGASKRNDIKQHLPSVDLRRKFWESFFDDPRIDLVSERNELEEVYRNTLNAGTEEQGSTTWIDFGSDVELLPMKALRLMQKAEVVFYSKDCPFDYVDLIRRDAERLEYTDDVDLSKKLLEAKESELRVVVFIAPESSQFNLLKNGDLHIRLGRI